MAAHHLTVAKATFAASLLRPDVTRVSRDEVADFHNILDRAVRTSTRENIQTCKHWLLEHIVPSTQRASAFVKYAILLANQPTSENKATSIRRRNLHVIYLLHDLLHHTKHHSPGTHQWARVAQSIENVAVELFRSAASDQKPRICKRLWTVLDIWKAERFLAPELLAQINQVISDPSAGAVESGLEPLKETPSVKELPYIMPASHGDPTLPFYELPAANFIPHIIPNKSIAMRAEDIKPLQFRPGPADPKLINVVQTFLEDVKRLDDPYEYLDDAGIVPEVDDLGQLSYRDGKGDLIEDTYYGWSRLFCEQMKHRRKVSHGQRTRSRSRSDSSGSSRDRSPPKRRRLSNSSAGSAYEDRYRAGFSMGENPRGTSRSISPPVFSGPSRDQIRFNSTRPPLPVQGFPPAIPFPLGPNGLPMPPPRPPNWNGPWPPPLPPPPPPSGYSGSFGMR